MTNQIQTKTTCRVKHRDYVPYGYIALEYCHVNFFGDNAQKFDKEWHDIYFEKYYKYKPILESLERELIYHKNELESFYKSNAEFKKNRSIIGKLFNKKNKAIDLCITERKKTIEDLETSKKEMESDRWFSNTQLVVKIEFYLKKNGFNIINTSQSGSDCVDKIDVWEKIN